MAKIKLRKKRERRTEVDVAWALGFRQGQDEGATEWKRAFTTSENERALAHGKLQAAREHLHQTQQRLAAANEHIQALKVELGRAMKELGQDYDAAEIRAQEAVKKALEHRFYPNPGPDLQAAASQALAAEQDRALREIAGHAGERLMVNNEGELRWVGGIDFAEAEARAVASIAADGPPGLGGDITIRTGDPNDPGFDWRNLQRYAEEDPPEGTVDFSRVRPVGGRLTGHRVEEDGTSTRPGACNCDPCRQERRNELATYRRTNQGVESGHYDSTCNCEDCRAERASRHTSPPEEDEGHDPDCPCDQCQPGDNDQPDWEDDDSYYLGS